MSKVSMSSRPEPGYENMDHFSINVDYVAEMLRTIEFQTGDSSGTSTAWGRHAWDCPGQSPAPWHLEPFVGVSPPVHTWGCVAPQALPSAPPTCVGCCILHEGQAAPIAPVWCPGAAHTAGREGPRLRCAPAPQSHWERMRGMAPWRAARLRRMRTGWTAWRHPRLLRVSSLCAMLCQAVLGPGAAGQ